MNMPNALTVSRLLATPLVMALLLAEFPYHDQLAAVAFVLVSLTDTLDGNLARRRRQVTELGKFLDPLADKLFILAVLVVLLEERELAAWVVIAILARELVVTVLRSISAGQGSVIAAAPSGKTKTVMQVGAILLVILQRPYPALSGAAQAAIWVAVVFTLLSGIDYLWRFRSVIWRGERRPARPQEAPAARPITTPPAAGTPPAASPGRPGGE